MSIQFIISVLNASLLGDDTQQKECLTIAHNHLTNLLHPKPTLADMEEIYTKDGYIPAIKAWRAASGKGLKDAKDDIVWAAAKYNWKDNLVGKYAKIICQDDNLNYKDCIVMDRHVGHSDCEVKIIGTGEIVTVSVSSLSIRQTY